MCNLAFQLIKLSHFVSPKLVKHSISDSLQYIQFNTFNTVYVLLPSSLRTKSFKKWLEVGSIVIICNLLSPGASMSETGKETKTHKFCLYFAYIASYNVQLSSGQKF